jgi:hypothetical protein
MYQDLKTRRLLEQKNQYERGLTAGLYAFPKDEYETNAHYKLGYQDGIRKALLEPINNYY